MRRSLGFGSAIAALCVALSSAPVAARSLQQVSVTVEPADLATRGDLVGREVVVDDRIRYFQFHPNEGYDEIHLRRTPVIFRLPRPLRPQTAPGNPAVQVRGVLRREGESIVCDVTSFQLLPSDSDRLDQSVAQLPANDFRARKTWSAWALQRSKDFADRPLEQKALRVEGEALRIEADSLRGDADLPRAWMGLAEEARRRRVPEPEPSALAHKSMHAQLTGLSSRKDLDGLVAAVERFFPAAREKSGKAAGDLGNWRSEYDKNPGNAYRNATSEIRPEMDRRLWADAVEKRTRAALREDPDSAPALADQAEAQLPERTQFVSEIREAAIGSAFRRIAALRLAEVRSLAETFRRYQRPEKADGLLRDWLKVQRTRLSDADADGRLSLATLHEEMVSDRKSALELIGEAWKIDPGSKEVAQAYRSRGYRKVGEEWAEDSPSGTAAEAGDNPAAPPGAPKGDQSGLRGLDSDQVRRKLGNKPDRVVYCGTKGRLVEQWIYLDPRRIRYVNFIHAPGELKPRVTSDYSLPRTRREGPPANPR